jgi:ABC-type branched-subunit amino acid transport system ATPase component
MLKIKNLHWWVWKIDILKSVDFNVKKWEAIWIVWPNWSWKTSLLNVINGFNIQNKWEIILEWNNIENISTQKRALKWIWRVFQSSWIFKELTLFENLALSYTSRLSFYYKFLPLKFLPKNIKNEIHDSLKELHLYDKINNKASDLSWWQMRLLEIARLYLQDTKIYLLDEPTAWVSPKLKWIVSKLIKKILKKWKIVIIVEHDFSWLWDFVDRLIVMDDWKIVLDWKYNQIKNNNKLRELYFW